MEAEDPSTLEEKLASLIPAWKERLARIKRDYGATELGSYTVQDTLAGSRNIKSLLWDVSMLDPNQGILYRGFSIPHCLSSLPRPLPEAHLWLLLTGGIPSPSQAQTLSVHLRSRAQQLPDVALRAVLALPPSSHPMTQLVSGVMALQTQSRFCTAFDSGAAIPALWRPALDDCLTLISQLPSLAAFIYQRSFKNGHMVPPDPNLDLAANFCHMLGYDDQRMHDMMRMYLVIHSDHEGGAVSSHAVRLVGSALADPFRAFAAGMNGCAGPLHGLAIQEAFRWLRRVLADVGQHATTEELEEYIWRTLKEGKIIPGFGHALLKQTDPRYTCLYQFCESNFGDDPLFQLLAKLGQIVPSVMIKQGKVRNPWPNVDAIIGIMFNHFGLVEEQFFPVMLGVARSLGALSQLVWDRALCLPIERPSSVTLDWIENFCKSKDNEKKGEKLCSLAINFKGMRNASN